MKRIFLFTAIVMIVSGVMAQKIKESEVPSSVMKVYKMKQTDSLDVSWEKWDNFYTAIFTKSNLKASMVIGENAEWIWTRWEVPAQYLPKKVKEYISTNYASYKTIGAVIEYKQGGEFYLVKLKKKKVITTLRFTIKNDFVGIEPEIPTKDAKDKPADKSGSKDK
jgi:hypothetical protein